MNPSLPLPTLSLLVTIVVLLALTAPAVSLPETPCIEPKRSNLAICTPVPNPPVNCQLGGWGSWSSCSVGNCQEGTQTRTRSITVSPCCGGTACGSTSESRSCTVSSTSTSTSGSSTSGPPTYITTITSTSSTFIPKKRDFDPACDVDCEWSTWSSWSTCSQTCGTGSQARTRSVDVIAQGSGALCTGTNQQTQNCNTQVCDVDCEVTEWGQWTSCSVSCGNGSQSRTRTITQAQAGNGATCPSRYVSRSCSNGLCPVDCVVGGWTQWTSCSLSCGGGTRSRSRTNTPPVGTGAACPSSSESESCNTHLCDVDCVQSSWSSYSQCDEPCGPGEKTRTRSITTQPVANGDACGPSSETASCDLGPCATECEVSAWSGWGSCNASCGGGSQSRTRTVIESHGFTCPVLSESQSCNDQLCDIDCEVSAWSVYGGCSVSCGGGTQTRTRTVTTAQQASGAACPVLSESNSCNTQVCDVDCVVDSWDEFSACTVECGGGEMTRTRDIITQPVGNGASCPELSDTDPCNTHVCPVDCEVSEWSETECTEPCGSGTITRTRYVDVAQAGTGAACPSPLYETIDCNTQPCVTSCEVTEWSAWSECSTSCGDGTSGRFREVTQEPENADPCPPLTSIISCNLGVCAADCEVSEWTEWTDCSKSCGGGSRDRERTVLVPPAGGGSACPTLEDSETCNDVVCDVDCQQGLWSEWSSCSGSCDIGTQSRSRATLTSASGNGVACGPSTGEQACDLPPCQGEAEPQDCIVNEWTEWGSCDCDTECVERSRTLTMETNGGDPCDPDTPLSDSKDCPVCPPVDCVPGEWSQWSSCSCSNFSPVTRSRTITPAQYGGECVDNSTSETQECQLDCSSSSPPSMTPSSPPPVAIPETPSPEPPVPSTPTPPPPSPPSPSEEPVDCVAGGWSFWSDCVCGGSPDRTRSRNITPESNGGICNLHATETKPCQIDCEVRDCELGPWSFWSACDCDGAATTDRYRELTPAKNGGLPCESTELEQIEDCLPSCLETVDCSLKPWGEWSECECGSNIITRSRIRVQAINGGAECSEGDATASLEHHETCNPNCPVENPCLAIGLTADCEVIEDEDSSPDTSSPVVANPEAVGITTSDPVEAPTNSFLDDVPLIIQHPDLVLPDRTTIEETHVVFEGTTVNVEGTINMGDAAVGINENSFMTIDGDLNMQGTHLTVTEGSSLSVHGDIYVDNSIVVVHKDSPVTAYGDVTITGSVAVLDANGLETGDRVDIMGTEDGIIRGEFSEVKVQGDGTECMTVTQEKSASSLSFLIDLSLDGIHCSDSTRVSSPFSSTLLFVTAVALVFA